MIGIIYLLTSPSGKQYVGQTHQTFHRRLIDHKCSKRDHPINRAIKKYGLNNFKKEIIITVQTDENNLYNQLNKLERYFIELYNTFGKYGYNANDGGKKFKVSDDTRIKMGIASKNHPPMSEENRRLIGDRAKGNKWNVGRKKSKESVEKTRLGSIKSIIQYSLTNEYIKEWESAREAYNELGIEYKNISAVCRGKRNIAGGYKWKFK